MWSFSSPYFNPLDLAVCGLIESKACAILHPNVASLKVSAEEEYAGLSPDSIVKVSSGEVYCCN